MAVDPRRPPKIIPSGLRSADERHIYEFATRSPPDWIAALPTLRQDINPSGVTCAASARGQVRARGASTARR
jgi:hypothetical protein